MACMNVLLTLGHPRKVSLCAALCAAYREGACGGANVETLVLADLAFDPYVPRRIAGTTTAGARPRDRAPAHGRQRVRVGDLLVGRLVPVRPAGGGGVHQ
jgi:putative NADPH-quinone reductase